MIPLYGFLDGDTLGLLILVDPEETVGALAERMARSASVRVATVGPLALRSGGRTIDPGLTVAAAGLEPLDRFDVGRTE
jgi:hypothetical protein